MNNNIRKAEVKDASRIAEILIFAKRTAYRPIFKNDIVSFNEMQVLDLALNYKNDPKALDNIYVYDDGIVKGIIHWSIDEADKTSINISELYIDPFFQGQGIGELLIKYCLAFATASSIENAYLWVLEKNLKARTFYEKNYFSPDGARKLEEGTPEYTIKYCRKLVF